MKRDFAVLLTYERPNPSFNSDAASTGNFLHLSSRFLVSSQRAAIGTAGLLHTLGASQMPVALRAFHSSDIQHIDQWALNIGIEEFMSRSRPKNTSSTAHDPSNGLLWFVIIDAGIDIGTIWIEPSEQSNESTLGLFLGDQSTFGRGIGTQAIRLALSEFWALFPSKNVVLNVCQANSRAIACYKKIGFSIIFSGSKISQLGDPIPFFKMQLKPCCTIA